MGANTAIFSVLEGVVLSPLPYRQPCRLATVSLYNRSLKYPTYLAYLDYLDWRQSTRSFEQIAAFTARGFDLSSPGDADHLDGLEISSKFVSTLGGRVREFGMALGAETKDVLRIVTGRGFGLAITGVAIGIVVTTV